MHVQTMLQLLVFCMDLVWIWKSGELEQIVNIPVTQIVEEIAEVSKSSFEWRSIPNIYFEGIQVFLG